DKNHVKNESEASQKNEPLPESERNLLEHGSTYIGLNAALCGLIANGPFQSIFNVTQAPIAAGLPMAVTPFLTAHVAYKSFVSLPLNTGDLNCETCTVTWGLLAGLVLGGLCPVFLAIPVNGGLTARYESTLLQEKRNNLLGPAYKPKNLLCLQEVVSTPPLPPWDGHHFQKLLAYLILVECAKKIICLGDV
uniref:Transmembrane protein 126A n=1 Tax=Prolemur simus TaxID=1328070 RepID=A0A8C8YEL2_PROSS